MDASIDVARHVQSRTLELPSSQSLLSLRTGTRRVATARTICRSVVGWAAANWLEGINARQNNAAVFHDRMQENCPL
jgi:hypothetical protein